MNVQNMLRFTADLSHGVTLTPLRMAFVRGEALAHMFIITAYENNQKVDLTGATVNGYMMRADQTTLTFNGSVSDGNAVISLPGAAYSVTGRFRLAIQAAMNGVTTTLFYGEGAVSPSTTDIVAISEEILMPSLENIEAQVEEMVAATAAAKAAAQGAVVRNLLDNSDFLNPINQRGLNSATMSGTFIVDRWQADIANHDGLVSLNSNGITCAPSASNYCGLCQLFERYAEMAGKTYTVAICVGNVWYCVSFEMGNFAQGAMLGAVAFFSVPNVHIILRVQAGSSAVTIQRAALYEGSYTAETLPAYQPKGYAAELMECMRYYQTMIGTGRVPYLITPSQRAYSILLTQEMRIAPTVTLKDCIEYHEGTWGTTNAVFASQSAAKGNFIVTADSTINSGERPFAFIAYEASADL